MKPSFIHLLWYFSSVNSHPSRWKDINIQYTLNPTYDTTPVMSIFALSYILHDAYVYTTFYDENSTKTRQNYRVWTFSKELDFPSFSFINNFDDVCI